MDLKEVVERRIIYVGEIGRAGEEVRWVLGLVGERVVIRREFRELVYIGWLR